MTAGIATLNDTLRAIIERGPATIGAVICHVERGERFGYDAERAFPAASVFKAPVLVEAFRRIGRGEIALSDRWELTDDERSTGSGVLVRLQEGLQPTVRDLLTLMLIISDNTATDMLVRRLGPEAITATMRELGLTRTVVVYTCRDLLKGILGSVPPGLSPHETARYLADHPADPDSFAYAGTDQNNITTPAEMMDLFRRIHTGDGMDAIGVDSGARGEMRAILLQQQLNDRMPRFLPAGVPVAHKTGSLSGPWAVRNDAGLVDLGARGTLAMAFFTRTRVESGLDAATLNRLLTDIDMEIAALTRAAYDHYTVGG
ncbi:MAG: serine hydrolase [Chloroflexi bacterium]|nr:serine hydrolase [Chloroflexota bacterium]